MMVGLLNGTHNIHTSLRFTSSLVMLSCARRFSSSASSCESCGERLLRFFWCQSAIPRAVDCDTDLARAFFFQNSCPSELLLFYTTKTTNNPWIDVCLVVLLLFNNIHGQVSVIATTRQRTKVYQGQATATNVERTNERTGKNQSNQNPRNTASGDYGANFNLADFGGL